ncbi:putative acyl-CoA synthetase [Gordonia hirsuta DSM 44140 = NBRC 16056]|uniref:Putative acyl-CoA synthetase n=1 Tax=Gordonia hirsuta DSM 44140 = NBRC 16056 TaxID=1121927 RepID=L7L6D4_9ACTN|nr:long-chain fatty acid--CoA ligase [Gordonia hirsuta]GAC56715.1 putative acyl-CoA synthetase [Gordonia hirsuta DSM 44140 = NBRC 16056]
MTGLSSWITRRAVRTPDALALVDATTGASSTYAQMAATCARRAAALRTRGVRRGDRVMVIGLNSTAQLETLFAAARLGAITVPVNFRLSPDEIAYLISDSTPTLLLHDDMFAELAAGAADAAPHHVDLVHLDALDEPEAAFGDEEPVRDDDVALIMYTSGTTGKPKGAMLTHGNLEANAVNILTAGEGLTPKDSTLAVAPLFHIGGLALYVLPMLFTGGAVVVAPAFDPAGTLQLLAKHRITVHFMVPAMWDAMSKVPDFDDADLSALRCLLCGGAPCPLPVIDFYQDKGLTFMEGFGMTELSPAAAILEAQYVRSHAGSVGRAVPLSDVRIVDGDDREVLAGEVGELLISGPNVFVGYWGLPAVTAQEKRGGWFHTGDLARMDEDGFITLVDRKKDMIVTGGENVYPIEVEQVLYTHPDVDDAAVIGLPDETWGEGVTAVIALREGASTTAEDLITYCRERIAHFKSPRRVEFVDVLPRNATGKLLKRDLRERYGSSASAVTR